MTDLLDAIPAELLRFLVLRRALRGHLTLSATGMAIDGGRRMPDYLIPTLHGLIDHRLLDTTGDVSSDARRSVQITESGAQLYNELDAHRAEGGRWHELARLDEPPRTGERAAHLRAP